MRNLCQIALFAGICFLGIATGPTAASEPPETVIFDTRVDSLVVTNKMQWYREAEDEDLKSADAMQRYQDGLFEPVGQEWAELGMMDATVWVAGTITNASQDDTIILEFRNPRMSRISLFVPGEDGTFTRERAGVLHDFDKRTIQHPMPAFPMSIARGETKSVLLKLQNIGDFRFRVWLWDRANFTNRAATAYYPELITIGVLTVLALFHLLVFISLHERTYIYLSFFVTFWLLFYMAGNGTGHFLLWRDFSWLSARANTLFLVLMCASFTLFSISYLETRSYAPRLYKLALVFVALCLVHLVFSMLTDLVVRLLINRYLSLGTIAMATILALGAWRDRRRLALFFLGSWFFVLLAAGLLVLMSTYMVGSRWLMDTPLVNFMFLFSIMMWSFELTGRIKVRAREQREILEQQVHARTHQLQKALNDVKTLSGLLPICSSCKKIRDDRGYWNSVESYVTHHTNADFTHGICPDCYGSLYPEVAKRRPHQDTPPQRSGPPAV